MIYQLKIFSLIFCGTKYSRKRIYMYALTSYETERLSQQIGIRKVHGTSAFDILAMLLGKFTRWVDLYNLIAFPLAFYAIYRWLQQFTGSISGQILRMTFN
jgi:hypothetical protein